VLAWQDDGQLALDFDAAQCKTDRTADADGGGGGGGGVTSRVYVGIDGFMVPMVTDAEAGRPALRQGQGAAQIASNASGACGGGGGAARWCGARGPTSGTRSSSW
jgi:hypothetical protein